MTATKRPGVIGGGSAAKRSHFDVDLILLNLRQEYSKRCACKEDFPLTIVLQHQLYAHFSNRTLVDRRIEELVQSGRLRAIRMGAAEDETALIDFEEFQEYCLAAAAKNKQLMKTFLESLKSHWDVVFTREQLEKFDFTDKQISLFIRMGVLSLRKNVGSYWLSIPGVGEYVRHLETGRKALQQTVKKTKFRQILRNDLEKRKLGRTRLSVSYLIDDAIGRDIVEATETTSGSLLTLTD